MLSEYQLKIGDIITVLLVMLKDYYQTFLIKKNMWFIIKAWTFTWGWDQN